MLLSTKGEIMSQYFRDTKANIHYLHILKRINMHIKIYLQANKEL